MRPIKLVIHLITLITGIVLTLAVSSETSAQDTVEIEPLFEYPVAPEELASIEDKSNYLVEHFWDNMDFKSKDAVDQNAFNHAFKVYVAPLRFSDRNKALQSVDKLIEKASKNPTLLYQLVKAAEENLYSVRAEFWIDEIYVKFLEAIVKNKKVSDGRKKRYGKQYKALSSSMPGNKCPEFSFETVGGNTAKYFPMSTPTLIIFGSPTLPEWRMIRIKMEMNLALREAIDKGKVNIIFIVPFELEGWKSEVDNYSATWTVGYAPQIDEMFDLRMIPSFYVIGNDGKISGKNLQPADAIDMLLSEASKKQ